MNYSLFFYNPEIFATFCQKSCVLRDCDTVYLPLRSFSDPDIAGFINNSPFRAVAYFPFVNKGKAREDLICRLSDSPRRRPDGYLLQNIGDIMFFGQNSAFSGGLPDLSLDYGFNIANAESALFWSSCGKPKIRSFTVSPELDAEQMKLFPASFTDSVVCPEIIVYGRIVAMRTEHCVISDSDSFHCGKCGKNGCAGYYLRDRGGHSFPIIGDSSDCRNIILTPRPVNLTNIEFPENCIMRYNIFDEDDVLFFINQFSKEQKNGR